MLINHNFNNGRVSIHTAARLYDVWHRMSADGVLSLRKKIAQDYLSEFCSATAEGVSLLGISTAAKKLGMRTVCGKLSVKQLDNEDLPCILHWKQNHFVVLYKVKKGDRFCIADPGKGLVTYSREEFVRFNHKLSEHEYHICLLIKSGFNNSDIAILTHKDKTSISQARKRLYKKMFLCEGESSEFDKFIYSL